MKILIVGGGTGGHVVPAMVVTERLFLDKPRARVEFWTDAKNYEGVCRRFKEAGLSKVKVKKVVAGKFRRYAGWKLYDYFAHLWLTVKDLIFGNIIGAVRFLFGFLQSFFRLLPRDGRPDVIFLKGGYVGLPVGLAAGILKIPYIIHESDAKMGLANRLVAPKAKVVATALLMKGVNYGDNMGKYRWVGVPVDKRNKKVGATQRKELKKALGLSPSRKLVVITGGSQGSRSLNEATREILGELTSHNVSVGLITGKKLWKEMSDLLERVDDGKFRMWDFCLAMNEVIGAADVVVSRAGASTIAELSAMRKAVILVPFARLPGSHQVKNALELEKNGAVAVVDNDEMDEKPSILAEEILKLISDEEKCEVLAKNLSVSVKTDDGRALSEIILQTGSGDVDGGGVGSVGGGGGGDTFGCSDDSKVFGKG